MKSRSIPRFEETMSLHSSLAMYRASEPRGTCLESPEAKRPRRWRGGIALAALAAALFSVAASAGDEPLRAADGPGPGPIGPGPGCNLIPAKASTGTKVDISQFPPPDSLTDPELAGPVQLLRSGKFDLPIEQLTRVNVPAGTPRGTITLPLFKGAVKTASGLKPAWYVILDAGDQGEADRLGVNFSKKLHNGAAAARPATIR